jgi:hypothetical protein
MIPITESSIRIRSVETGRDPGLVVGVEAYAKVYNRGQRDGVDGSIIHCKKEGWTVTKTQAEAVRVKWKQQVDPPACEHPYQEMERTDWRGRLDGEFPLHCMRESVTWKI